MKARTRIFAQHLGAFIASITEDILIISGLGVITYATFQLCNIAGWYCLGACLFGAGVWMAVHPKGGDE